MKLLYPVTHRVRSTHSSNLRTSPQSYKSMKVSWSGLLISPGITKPWGRLMRGTATTGAPHGREVSGRLGPATDLDEEAAAKTTDGTATGAAGEEAETVVEEGAVTPDDPLWARLLVLLLLITKCKVAIDKVM